MLGLVLHHLRRDREAQESYWRAIALDPQFDEAYYNFGVLLRETAPAEAETLFLKLLRSIPTTPLLIGNLDGYTGSLIETMRRSFTFAR